jgi:Fe2+ transport system protein B
MAHYKADVWLGSNSGMQTVEINSSSYNGVTEQICNIYHVSPDKIRNIREVSTQSIQSSFTDGPDGTMTLIGLGFFIWLFVFYTPYFLTFLFGSSGAWIATKLTTKTSKELLKPENDRAYSVVLIVSLFCGGFGLVVGDKIQRDYFNESKVEQQK